MKRIGGHLLSPRRRRPAFWLIALLATFGVAAAARTALQMTPGLTAEYFDNDQRAGTPTLRAITPSVSTEQLNEQWRGSPPATFGVRWFGYLTVASPTVAHVYLSGKDLGPVNEPLQVRCGRWFIRLATPREGRYPEWVSRGETINVACQTSTRIEILPTPGK